MALSFSLRLQRLVGWLCLLPVASVIVLMLRIRGRYEIKNLKEVRDNFLEISKERSPLIVCANHLTLIDSIILMWSFASPLHYFYNYRLFCWNLPAVENTKRHISWRVLTFISKCLLIDRMADPAKSEMTIENVTSLLAAGDLVMIFPEGGRSRTGRINPKSVSYGIGKLLKALPACKVLCVYQRGAGQGTYSDFPKKGEKFSLKMELIHPRTVLSGLKAVRELSEQVVNVLVRMEEGYFESRMRTEIAA